MSVKSQCKYIRNRIEALTEGVTPIMGRMGIVSITGDGYSCRYIKAVEKKERRETYGEMVAF